MAIPGGWGVNLGNIHWVDRGWHGEIQKYIDGGLIAEYYVCQYLLGIDP